MCRNMRDAMGQGGKFDFPSPETHAQTEALCRKFNKKETEHVYCTRNRDFCHFIEKL